MGYAFFDAGTGSGLERGGLRRTLRRRVSSEVPGRATVGTGYRVDVVVAFESFACIDLASVR